MTTEYTPRKWTWWEYLIVAVTIAALALGLAGLAGCGSYPTKMTGTFDPTTGKVEMQTTEIGTAVPMTGFEVTANERTPAEESGGWWGLLSGALAVVGGLQFAGPKSWSNWGKVFAFGKNSPTWPETGRALVANLGVIHSPEVTPAAPDRTDP